MTTTYKKTWEVFWDLQCPYSKANWKLLPKIKDRFGDEYDFSVHLTSLLFHSQAFVGQCASHLIMAKLGDEARLKFIDACFEQQDIYMNAAVGDARKSEVDAIFAGICEKLGFFEDSDKLTKSEFLDKLHDWELATKPAWTEHKEALELGVHGAPKSVIDGVLMANSESDWTPDRWAKALESSKKQKADK